MKTVLVKLIYDLQGAAKEAQEIELLRMGNVWLQNKLEGRQDSLLLVGVNFVSPEAIETYVGPLGLSGVDYEPLPPIVDEDSLGGDVAQVVEEWLRKKHPTAICFANWRWLNPCHNYSKNDWWWSGVEAAKAAEMSSIHEGINKLVPADFRPQAPTWLELLLTQRGHWMFDSEQANFEVVMSALGLARWLSGYEGVSENSFYDFSYRDAADALPLDNMRLAAEVLLNNPNDVVEDFDNEEATEDELRVTCLRACLLERNAAVAGALREVFGGEVGLLWALHSTIWPDHSTPMLEAGNSLVAGQLCATGDLMQEWKFVSEGWGLFAED